MISNIISMTELQKLSLKKLRKKNLPLFVMDRKSKKGGFVIVDIESYQEKQTHGSPPLTLPHTTGGHATLSRKGEREVKIPDYRNMGLFWDAPHFTNEKFHDLLKNPSDPEHPWAVRRLLEYARSEVVTKILTLPELQQAFSKVRLRPVFQEAWGHAIRYWTENP